MRETLGSRRLKATEDVTRSKFPSPRQQQVLDIIREVFGGSIRADRNVFLAIAKRVGWKDEGSIRDTLFSLREKGYMQSSGGMISRPDRWRIVNPSEANAQHVHN